MTDSFMWKVDYKIYKYKTDLAYDPYEILEKHGNLLMYKGASAMWEYMLGNGNNTSGNTLAFFNSTNAKIVVGDNSTANAAVQTDLFSSNISTSRAYGDMDSTFPQHTDGATSANATITFQSTFGSNVANFIWNEWGIFNGTTNTSRMLNRKVEYLGTKNVGEVWTFKINITLS
jgi:hypothetical protein